MLLVAMAVAFGFVSIGFFTVRQFALAEGVEHQEPADFFGVASFASFGMSFMCAAPSLTGAVGG